MKKKSLALVLATGMAVTTFEGQALHLQILKCALYEEVQ